MWGKVKTDYRTLYEGEITKSTIWLAELTKSIKTIRSQQKGMYRMSRKLKKLRSDKDSLILGIKSLQTQISELHTRLLELACVIRSNEPEEEKESSG